MNNKSDYSKRTVTQVSSILKQYGVDLKPENQGDGRMFYIPDASLKTRVAIKKAGFIIILSEQNNKGIYFKTTQ